MSVVSVGHCGKGASGDYCKKREVSCRIFSVVNDCDGADDNDDEGKSDR